MALYSPLLTADEREAVSAFFVGQSGVRYAKKISVTADKIVCRVSNVDITARSCELTFKGAKQTITGRRASEIFATEAMAGVAARRRRRIGVRKPLEAQLHARSGRDQAEGRRRRDVFVRDGELSESSLFLLPLWEKVARSAG